MILQCTKKLLEYLGGNTRKDEEATEPLFTWSANLITLNRRKTLVAVNAASRCVVVLHGLRAANRPRIGELLREAIRIQLEQAYVRSDMIDQYLSDCGETLSYAANTSRSTIAYCSKACKTVSLFSDLLEPEDMFQKKLLPKFNDDVLSSADYRTNGEEMIALLRERYGREPLSCQAVELEVELELTTPCTRTLLIPTDRDFYQLHRIMQNAFGWEDRHLHEFILEEGSFGRPEKVVTLTEELEDVLEGIVYLDSLQTTLKDVFPKYESILYVYDFGDEWVHRIRLKRLVEDCPTPYPQCLAAEGDAPMEDCGGPAGFDRVCQILADPKHPEYKEIRSWVGSNGWKRLNLEEIQRRVRFNFGYFDW